ncbi:MAG: DegV family protein [Coriobacteriales bacterium]
MGDYVLSCESTADLSEEKFKQIGVEYVCFHYYLDDKDLPDDLGKTMAFPDFYQAMVNGADTRTAAVGTGDYVAFWRPFLEQGRDILHCSLSSGISSTYESAAIAAEQLRAEFPERTIYLVDSLNASSGFGLLMQKLSDMRAAGAGIDEAYEWAKDNRLSIRARFFSTDLTFYIKGGRVSPVSGYVGNLLGICPLLDIDEQGKLIPREKVRSKKKVIKRIVECMLEDVRDGADYSGRVFISHSACMEDAQAVAELVGERLPKAQPAEIFWVGTTIGSHTGPGTVALFYECDPSKR